jgi:hypothetical protein
MITHHDWVRKFDTCWTSFGNRVRHSKSRRLFGRDMAIFILVKFKLS